MRPVHCDRPSLHAVIIAGLSILVVATAVPLDVTVVAVNVAMVVAIAIVIAVVVSLVCARLRETCRARIWRPLVVTLLTRAHLLPRDGIARSKRIRDRLEITRARTRLANVKRKSTRRIANLDHPTDVTNGELAADPGEPALIVRESARARARSAHLRRAGIAYNRAMTERAVATRPSKAGAGTRRL